MPSSGGLASHAKVVQRMMTRKCRFQGVRANKFIGRKTGPRRVGPRKEPTLNMAYSIWELLTFPPGVLEERLRTMTFHEREAERLEAKRQAEARQKGKNQNEQQTK